MRHILGLRWQPSFRVSVRVSFCVLEQGGRNKVQVFGVLCLDLEFATTKVVESFLNLFHNLI